MSAPISALGVALSESGFTLEKPTTLTLALIAIVATLGSTRFMWEWLKAWFGNKNGK